MQQQNSKALKNGIPMLRTEVAMQPLHSPPKMIADIINTEEDEFLGEYQDQEEYFKKLSPRVQQEEDQEQLYNM